MTRVRLRAAPIPLTLLALLIAAAVQCAPALASPSTMTVGAKRNGKTVWIKPGARLKIVLGGASASTGYHWSVTRRPDRRVLRVVIDGKLENAGHCAANAVGCAQNTVFVFSAASTTNAKTELKLALLPPGRDAKPVKTYTLKVHVT